MEHLSFFWLPNNKDKLIKALESEFAQLVEQSISTGKISLPPIPDVVLKIQQLCTEEHTTIADIANALLEDPGLAAVVVRVANSVIFNRRNITCNDLTTAVSRLGILRVRDIVTAQAIEQLKHSVNLTKECNAILVKSAAVSRELGAAMVLVVQEFKKHEPLPMGISSKRKPYLLAYLQISVCSALSMNTTCILIEGITSILILLCKYSKLAALQPVNSCLRNGASTTISVKCLQTKNIKLPVQK